jgi:hypothetical protein
VPKWIGKCREKLGFFSDISLTFNFIQGGNSSQLPQPGGIDFFFFAVTTTSNYQWTAGFHAFYDSSIASRV